MRELNRAEIDEFLRGEFVGRIGCHADGETYVVPVIYAYDGEAVYVYSIEGRKVGMMRSSPEVCFEVDRYDGPGEWRSAIAYGRYEELEGAGAERAKTLLRERFASGPRGPRPRSDGGTPVAFRIVIREVTGRRKRPE
jgi:nitroimidazol reductase NimA-like FMN-containing flavoprotein (pyridoxamine 5'-phosphate oxidase superfamily)